MKKNYFKKVLFSSMALLSVTLMNAQDQKILGDNGDPKMIIFNKGAQHKLSNAKQILRNQLQTSKQTSFKQLKSEKDELGFTHQKNQQYYKGIKVEFATYTMHAKQGKVISMNGEFYDIRSFDVQPSISKQQAFKLALDHTNADAYLWENKAAAKELGYKKPEGELVLLPNLAVKGEVNLAYKFDIYTTAPKMTGGDLYIDAKTGKVLLFNNKVLHVDNFGHDGRTEEEKHAHHAKDEVAEAFSSAFTPGNAETRYSGNREIETQWNGSYFTLNDTSRKVYTRNANNQGIGAYISNYTEFADTDNNWTAAEFHNGNKDDAALDAHWGAMITYDYWINTHNRDSYDANGADLRSYVHVDHSYDNAFWYMNVMSYGDGSSNGNEGSGMFDALTSIDVAAHEMGHAITQYTANLAYQRESGGLNEGFSDIWGAAVEHYAKGNGSDSNPDNSIWEIGDEIDRRNGSLGLRSMMNPKAKGQPDTYGGTYWQEPNCGTPTRSNDYCGVHTNSGVLNFWFYLLTSGSNSTDGVNDRGDNYVVNGIGIDKAAKIAYRLLNTYLSANSTYADARVGGIQAATDLYGENSAEVIATTNAFYAVGVGAEAVEVCDLPAPTNLASENISEEGFTLNWTAVPGATSYDVIVDGVRANTLSNSFNASGLISGTTYNVTVAAQCESTQTGLVATMNVKTAGELPLTYCDSASGSTRDEYIGNVTLANINNDSGAGEGYSDYTSISTDLTLGSTEQVSITPQWPGSTYKEAYGVWIDFNRDGDFDDQNEQVLAKSASTDPLISSDFDIPADAALGKTRMRVVMKYNGNPSACESSFSYGEVEDYTVNLVTGSSDTQAPSAPSQLSVSNITETTLDLNWTASTDNVGVTEYEVFQGVNSIGTTTETSLNITGLSAATSYEFTVKAKDLAGNISQESQVATATTTDVTAPSVPASLEASSITKSSVVLNWADSNDNVGVTEYEVYQTGNLIATTANNTYTVSGLAEATTYEFTVKAKDLAGNVSQSSNNLSVTTLSSTVEYCTSAGSRVSYEWIDYVAFGGMTNTTGENGGYGDFTAKVATVAKGSTTPLVVSAGFSSSSYTEYFTVWIDFNQNGTFETSEKVRSGSTSSSSNLTSDVTVPTTALTGETRMRVAMKYNSSSTACESFYDGEVEDYTVNITQASSINGLTNATTETLGNETSSLMVFPNPTTDIVQVKLKNSKALSYKVVNFSGQIVKAGKVENQKISIAELSAGIYVLEINDGQKVMTTKLVKK